MTYPGPCARLRTAALILVLAFAAPASAGAAITILLDGSRGFVPGRGFEAYRTMETFMVDRGFSVTRSEAPLSTVDLAEVDILFLCADWMAGGPHDAASRDSIAAFASRGGLVIALAEAPGPTTAALSEITLLLGIACGSAAAPGGKITVGEHPTVAGISGLTFPDGSTVEPGANADVIAVNARGNGVMAVGEAPSILFAVGAPVWRNDHWTEGREQVLRQALGWLADRATPSRRASWGGIKKSAGPVD